jgi:hypothetical protein
VALKFGGGPGSPAVPGGQVADDGTTTLLVDDTFTTPGMPPGASYSPKKSWNWGQACQGWTCSPIPAGW